MLIGYRSDVSLDLVPNERVVGLGGLLQHSTPNHHVRSGEPSYRV